MLPVLVHTTALLQRKYIFRAYITKVRSHACVTMVHVSGIVCNWWFQSLCIIFTGPKPEKLKSVNSHFFNLRFRKFILVYLSFLPHTV